MTTTCAGYCGMRRKAARVLGAFGYFIRPDDDDLDPHVFCSRTCANAARSLHPVSKPPGEPVPAMMPGQRCTREAKHGTLPHEHSRNAELGWLELFAVNVAPGPILVRCPYVEPAPGSALPLPGPPAQFIHEYDVRNPCTRDACAEARTALAEGQARTLEIIADLTQARARLAVTVGALERLGRETCAFDGSYANCWEAIEADDIDAGEGVPCARCVSLQALEDLPDARAALAPTGAPPAKETP